MLFWAMCTLCSFLLVAVNAEVMDDCAVTLAKQVATQNVAFIYERLKDSVYNPTE
jgi:hypothetical protein